MSDNAQNQQIERIGPMLSDGFYLQLLAKAKDKPEVEKLFLRLLLLCMPPLKNCGVSRSIRSGYNRLCALVFRLAPELFQGLTYRELAKMLEIESRTFIKQLAYVDAMLAHRTPARSRTRSRQTSDEEISVQSGRHDHIQPVGKLTGPSQLPTLGEVPRAASAPGNLVEHQIS